MAALRVTMEAVAPKSATPLSGQAPMAPSTLPMTQLAQQRPNLTAVARAVTPIQSNAADLALMEDTLPTPVVPCGAMMADFLMAYRRMLETASASGESAAAAGSSVLSRIRFGLSALMGRPNHDAKWHRAEGALENCLWELEKDIERLQKYKDGKPTSLSVQLAALRCTEAARMLRKLPQ